MSTFIMMMILTYAVTSELAERTMQKKVLERVYKGYIGCVNHCSPNQYGSLTKITPEGEWDCICYNLKYDTAPTTNA